MVGARALGGAPGEVRRQREQGTQGRQACEAGKAGLASATFSNFSKFWSTNLFAWYLVWEWWEPTEEVVGRSGLQIGLFAYISHTYRPIFYYFLELANLGPYGLNKGPYSQSYGFFSIVMYRYESWTIKKAESQRLGAVELWCWRRLSRVPWAARRPE